MADLVVRWSVGDVTAQGFEALGLSIHGAWNLFGRGVRYVVSVNTIGVQQARAATGPVPAPVMWRDVTNHLPAWLRDMYLAGDLAEGMAWKFAPLRMFPADLELLLDNDVILWDIPAGMREWMDDHRGRCLVAEDVICYFGRFAALCGPEPRNAGIRGMPPGFDVERRLRAILSALPSEPITIHDEQGVQTAVLSGPEPPCVVRLDEVTICSPFPPHLPDPGNCGAHFVGLNAHTLGWELEGRPAEEYTRENWERLAPGIRERIAAMRPLRRIA